ncbi:rhodanese-like domain-containing protein [Streptomyces sp. CBMA156]|uniref:rhodanese-like domain-containing protein n=1 Tax=Streptomyces sp. CBMA156 TaxID=1930280 RepID=UPI001661E239|nr:rhodanese-like domain-containing protein [Streptomyces sp. CBMA156]MBD0675823.1 sulfurtransferase [Streptomyces sp. CBMA156]
MPLLPHAHGPGPDGHSTPGQTTPTKAQELARTGAAVLLDVREAAEFTTGHAPGALHQPLIALVAGVPLPPEAAGRTVLAVCRSGNRSQRAAELLAQRGVEVLNVAGGMRAWALAGLPVTTPGGSAGHVI